MIVFTDIFTGDQVLSDSFSQTPLIHKGNKIEGIVAVQSKMISKEVGNIDIGANASAEEADEGTDDSVQKVNNLVDADTGFGYNGPMSMDLANLKLLYKNWCKETREKILADGGKPKDFVQTATAFNAFLIEEFSNLEVYQTKSYNGGLVIGWWDDDANTAGAPKFLFNTFAMKSEK